MMMSPASAAPTVTAPSSPPPRLNNYDATTPLLRRVGKVHARPEEQQEAE